MIFYYLYFAILLVNAILADKIIEINPEVIVNLPQIQITFIDANTTIHPTINTYLPYSLLDNYNINDYENITTKGQINISLEQQIEAYTLEGNIRIGEVNIMKYNFLYSEYVYFVPDLGIGLGYKFEDDSFSLIHSLYNSKQIEKKMFAFKPKFNEPDSLDEKMYFGGIPNNIHLKTPYQGYCDVQDGYQTWGCNLTKIIFNNKEYEINSYAVFHSTFEDFLSSNLLFELFTEKIFKDKLDNHICRLSISVGEEQCIVCTDGIENNNNTIDFEFAQMKISFKITQLFKKTFNNDWNSLFISNPYQEYGNKIILGSLFIRQFQYSVFDYDKKQVQFYSNTIPIQMGFFIKKLLSKMFTILAIFILFIDMLYLIILHYNTINIHFHAEEKCNI